MADSFLPAVVEARSAGVRSCKGRLVLPLKNHPWWVGAGMSKNKRNALEPDVTRVHAQKRHAWCLLHKPTTGHGTCHVSSDCASCTMEGERCECGGLCFTCGGGARSAGVRSSKGRLVPPTSTTAARACSPSVLPRVQAACSALKTMFSWIIGARTDAQGGIRSGDGSDAHCVLSLRSCRDGPHGVRSDAHGEPRF